MLFGFEDDDGNEHEESDSQQLEEHKQEDFSNNLILPQKDIKSST